MAKLPLVGYFGSVIDEGRKVIWPSRETVIRHTTMVIISVAVAVVIVAGVDFVLKKLVLLAIK